MTLICLVDGIDHYDNDEYEQDMMIVLKCILDLARDDEVLSALKILATNSSRTEFESAFKDDESSYLSMKGLPRINQEAAMLPSSESDDEED
ncbi:hypothetical protein CMQ_2227 [Grosmannia clavigera kw1407]|uniref:Uncharacterized protein n=1 Tax=Grosmannia clavigera (strain kw1407 / UAMH 11150) TaxID=655863 RepID=F0XJK1_GROCL|nr:uncharacterized protein CMQ_2227 [Grosmannia clavigera kw1407]EFX02178.1 hypothetical protein CMQ_2227 [Grosmannia clavigera kw1407]